MFDIQLVYLNTSSDGLVKILRILVCLFEPRFSSPVYNNSAIFSCLPTPPRTEQRKEERPKVLIWQQARHVPSC